MKRLRRRLSWLLVRLAEALDPDWYRAMIEQRSSGSPLVAKSDDLYDPSKPFEWGATMGRPLHLHLWQNNSACKCGALPPAFKAWTGEHYSNGTPIGRSK